VVTGEFSKFPLLILRGGKLSYEGESYNSKREPLENLTITQNERVKLAHNHSYKTLSLEGSPD
jgi:hypothetical protein